MSKKKSTPSDESQRQAEAIAKGTQKPSQTKEQTKLIAQGIAHGIHLFKQQEKAKARERDKARKKALKTEPEKSDTQDVIEIKSGKGFMTWLPWLLLLGSWSSMAAFWLFYH